MSKDEKPILGDHTKKVIEQKKEGGANNKESVGRNVGNVTKPADVQSLKKDVEAKKEAVLKKGKETKGKTWTERFQKQEPPQQQTQHKPSALQMKAQEQLRAAKAQETKVEPAKTASPPKQVAQKPALQQKAQQTKVATPPKTKVTKAPPSKGRGK